MSRWALIICLFLGATAQARVFNINEESFAPYFLASGGGSQIGTSALNGESGAGVTFDGGSNYNYSGEFGFLYARKWLTLRFGFEVIKPTALESTANDGSSDLYAVTGTMMTYVPKISLELNVHSGPTYRSFISLAAGTASMTMKNDYVLTSAGQTAYPGVTDHSVEAKASAALMSASLGYEGILSDTTTYVVEFGYRQLKFDDISYSKDVTTFSGSKVSGDPLLDANGNNRELDLTGGFIAIGFRFYM